MTRRFWAGCCALPTNPLSTAIRGARARTAASSSTAPAWPPAITCAPLAAVTCACRRASASTTCWMRTASWNGTARFPKPTRSSSPATWASSRLSARRRVWRRACAPASDVSRACAWPSASWSRSSSWARWARSWARRWRGSWSARPTSVCPWWCSPRRAARACRRVSCHSCRWRRCRARWSAMLRRSSPTSRCSPIPRRAA